MATAFKIENDVPMPGAREMSCKYPFGQMEKGQSFLVRSSKTRNFDAERAAATGYGKRKGMKFSARITPDGLRIWRIA